MYKKYPESVFIINSVTDFGRMIASDKFTNGDTLRFSQTHSKDKIRSMLVSAFGD
jgi:hypothetical protein